MKEKLSEQEIDELFDHMSELMSRLPETEKLDEKFRKAEAAKEILRCAAEAEEARRALESARVNTAAAVKGGERGGQFIFGNAESYAAGVLTDRSHRLSAALKKYGYPDAGEAKGDAVPDAELEELRGKLARFRTDYERTLAKCREYAEDE